MEEIASLPAPRLFPQRKQQALAHHTQSDFAHKMQLRLQRNPHSGVAREGEVYNEGGRILRDEAPLDLNDPLVKVCDGSKGGGGEVERIVGPAPEKAEKISLLASLRGERWGDEPGAGILDGSGGGLACERASKVSSRSSCGGEEDDVPLATFVMLTWRPQSGALLGLV